MFIPPILTTNDLPAAGDQEFYLNAASAAVRAYCGWHVTPFISEELVLDGSGGRVLQLPSKRVLGVSGVINDGEAVADPEWSADGLLMRPGGALWTRKYRGVTLTIDHGFDAADDVYGIVAGIASRAAMNPGGHVVNQRAGTQSVTLAAAGGSSASIPLLETEKRALDPYRLNWGP